MQRREMHLRRATAMQRRADVGIFDVKGGELTALWRALGDPSELKAIAAAQGGSDISRVKHVPNFLHEEACAQLSALLDQCLGQDPATDLKVVVAVNPDGSLGRCELEDSVTKRPVRSDRRLFR